MAPRDESVGSVPKIVTGGSDRQKVLMLVTAGLAGAVLVGMMVFVGGPASTVAQEGTPEGGTEQTIAGERLYLATCAPCHGDTGQGGVGPALDGSAGVARLRPEHIEELVQRGGERMPAVGPGWGELELEAVSAYIEQWWPEDERGAPSSDR